MFPFENGKLLTKDKVLQQEIRTASKSSLNAAYACDPGECVYQGACYGSGACLNSMHCQCFESTCTWEKGCPPIAH